MTSIFAFSTAHKKQYLLFSSNVIVLQTIAWKVKFVFTILKLLFWEANVYV
jgi:hypothetical protein